MFKHAKEYLHRNPKVKKAIGVVLVIVGLVAFLTPLTPGSWLAIIGFELLGIRILFLSKLKLWKRK